MDSTSTTRWLGRQRPHAHGMPVRPTLHLPILPRARARFSSHLMPWHSGRRTAALGHLNLFESS